MMRILESHLKEIKTAIFNNHLLIYIIRLLIGAIFLFSGLTKLFNHIDFINIVADYNILPDTLTLVYGQALPWLEICIGVLFILNLFIRFASIIAILIVSSFIFANIYSLIVPCPAGLSSCGCFGSLLFLDHKSSLIIDIFMLFFCAWLLFSPGTYLSFKEAGSWLKNGKYRYLTYKNYMVKNLMLLFALVLIFSVQCLVTVPSIKINTGLLKEYNQENTINDALSDGKKVFIYMFLDNCLYCQEQNDIIDELEKKYIDQIKFMRFNGVEYGDLIQQTKVTSYPLMLLIKAQDSEGSYIYKSITGYTNKDTLEVELRAYL
jgi:uncharacterized membrane protein YphA (DoxX/SURF4 family)/thiol-disulfide isomerase/thioredoxin